MKELTRICDAAPELSRAWKARAGDRVYVKYNIYFKEDGWTVVKSDDLRYKEGECHLSKMDDALYFKELRKFMVWLPDIGQTIDLLLEKYGHLSPLLTDFNRFVFKKGEEGRLINIYDFQILWILFYMFKIHSKVWDGEEFHKIQINAWGDIIENT